MIVGGCRSFLLLVTTRFSSIYLVYLEQLNHEVLLSVHHQLQMNMRMKNLKFRGFVNILRTMILSIAFDLALTKEKKGQK